MMHLFLYATLGFFTTAGAIAITRFLKRALRRPETYYSKGQKDG